MKTLLLSVKKTFTSSQTVHAKARAQYAHQFPGGSWSAPVAMANFLRELHIRNGGTLTLPDHGAGAHMGILANNHAPGLFPAMQFEVAEPVLAAA
jgi:3-oxoacyl-[acyl-carrier-protein] synthase III